jgi:hypothetical protein
MKKVISLLALLFVTSIGFAQEKIFHAYSAAVSTEGIWTDWYSVSINIEMYKDFIVLNTKNPQVYTLVGCDEDWYSDSKGGEQINLYAKDKNGKRCTLRFRVTDIGAQMYIDYQNVTIVYGIE